MRSTLGGRRSCMSNLFHSRAATHESNHQRAILNFCALGRLKEALNAILGSDDASALDPLTYSSVVQLCIDQNAKREGESIYGHLRRNGYPSDLRLDNKFVIFFGKSGDVRSALEVFDGMPRRTVVSWTAMISGYSQNGYYEEAVESFASMRRCGIWPNQFTFGSTLSACTGMGCVRSGVQVHGCAAKSGLGGDLFVQSALVDLYAKCGPIADAENLFGSMNGKDVASWNTMIGGYATRGLGLDSLRLFGSFIGAGFLPDPFTFTSVLKSCGVVRDLVNADKIHVLTVKLGFANDHVVAGALIDAYAKCRSLKCAKLIYSSLKNTDLIALTSLITGYSHDERYRSETLKLFSLIKETRFAIDDVIICSMLSSCAKLADLSMGRQIHAFAIKNRMDCDSAINNSIIDMYAKSGELGDARRAFDMMRNRNVISYTSIINGYGKHGLVEDAFILFDKMESSGLKPNDVTFLSILSACSHSGLTNKGKEYIISMVNDYGVQPRAEHYSCVVDLLGRGGEIKEAYEFARKLGANLNASLWGALLGSCQLHGNNSYGIMAAGYLFDMDPKSAVNYVVLSNIYAASNLWQDSFKVRKLIEDRYLEKKSGWSSLGFIKNRESLILDTS